MGVILIVYGQYRFLIRYLWQFQDTIFSHRSYGTISTTKHWISTNSIQAWQETTLSGLLVWQIPMIALRLPLRRRFLLHLYQSKWKESFISKQSRGCFQKKKLWKLEKSTYRWYSLPWNITGTPESNNENCRSTFSYLWENRCKYVWGIFIWTSAKSKDAYKDPLKCALSWWVKSFGLMFVVHTSTTECLKIVRKVPLNIILMFSC